MFPNDWKSEFSKARECGYCYIELFRDTLYNPNNPLWTAQNIGEIIDESIRTGVAIRHICDDYVLNCNWSELSAENVLTLVELIRIAGDLRVEKVVYPILDSICDLEQNELAKAISNIKKLCRIASSFGVQICLEINASADEMKKVIRDIDEKNVSLCIDTGNLFSRNYDVVNIIRETFGLYSLIHIKDKNLDGSNVVLGTGVVPIDKVIKVLDELEYEGEFTFENHRGDESIKTAKQNINVLKSYL